MRTWSTRISSKTFLPARNICWRRSRYRRSRFHTTMSSRSRACGLNSVKTQSSRSTSPISTPLAKALLASTSSTSWTPFTLTTWSKWWAMQMSSVWQRLLRTCKTSLSQSPSIGRRSWDRCRTCHVSLFLWAHQLIVLFQYREKWQDAPSSKAKFQVDKLIKEEKEDWGSWLVWRLQGLKEEAKRRFISALVKSDETTSVNVSIGSV